MLVNYHTHTSRCGHASGSDEQYVLAAIEAGIQVLGFSDHIPFEGIHAPNDRMDYDQIEDYMSSILALKEKYKAQIEIKLGFELEYYPELIDYYTSIRKRVDYLIVGQHYKVLNDYGYDNYCRDEDLDVYGDQVCAAMKSGLISIVAHPEYFMLGKSSWNEACEKLAHRIGLCAQATQIPLEINLNGIRFGKKKTNGKDSYPYPFMPFWEIISQYNVKTVYGLDAHRPLTLLESHRIDLFKEDFDQLNLHPDLNLRF